MVFGWDPTCSQNRSRNVGGVVDDDVRDCARGGFEVAADAVGLATVPRLLHEEEEGNRAHQDR